MTEPVALVANGGLDEEDFVALRGNPLNREALTIHIPALEARGVIVTRDGHDGPTIH